MAPKNRQCDGGSQCDGGREMSPGWRGRRERGPQGDRTGAHRAPGPAEPSGAPGDRAGDVRGACGGRPLRQVPGATSTQCHRPGDW